MEKLWSRQKVPFLSLLFLFLLFAFFPGAIISAAGQENPAQPAGLLFTDVPKEHWGYYVINQLVERKLLAGYPDGTFRPEGVLSRAEFAAILARVGNLAVEPLDKPTHQDVALSEWYAPAVGATYRYIGDFSGSEGSRLFAPAEPILREQAIAAFLKVRQDDQKTPINPNILSLKFKDHSKIKPEFKNMLAWAVEQGFVAGYADGTFRPRGTLTRAEAAALLDRMFPKIEVSIEAFLKSGKLAPLAGTDPQYEKLVEKLQRDYPAIAINQTPVKVRYSAADLWPSPGSREKLLYVFVAVDPFKYFTFSDVDFKNKPDAVLEFNENIMREVKSIFPAKQVIVLVGYVNTVYYDPTGVYEERFISYNEQERAWRIVRYYTGMRGRGEEILEKWIEK